MIMHSVALQRLHQSLRGITDILLEKAEPSLISDLDDIARKTVLVSAASYFETTLTNAVHSFCVECSNKNTLVPSIVRAKAINRQYHTWFSWESNNANSFFSLFGDDFKNYMSERISKDDNLEESIRAFMEIGRERNRLIHGDFSTFQLEKTAEEIHGLYEKALHFVSSVPVELKNCADKLARNA